MFHRIAEVVKILKVESTTAAGTTVIETDVVDTADYQGVAFLFSADGITTGAVTSVKVQQGAAANLSDAADLVGTNIPIADDDDNQTFLIDVLRPQERYVRVVVSRATQNAAIGTIYALLYGPARSPVTNAVADTLTVEKHDSPAEGTP
jgi:hypothetical protein